MSYSPQTISYQNVAVPGAMQSAARGYSNLNDLIRTDFSSIRGQTQGQQQQMIGGLGKRGMLDSSIANEAQSQLMAQREGAMNRSEFNWNEKNRELMLRGQTSINQIKQFNAQQQLSARQFNMSQAQQWEMHQQQMREQRNARRSSAWGSFLGGVGGIAGFALGGPAGAMLGQGVGTTVGSMSY